jgi:hypothetical protein
MKTECWISPRNSLVLILDPRHGSIPESMSGALLASTESCVAVGTIMEHDGPAHLVLCNDLSELVSKEMLLIFEGQIETPHQEICICDISMERLLSLKTGTSESHVRILVNDASEPDEIRVLVEA